MAYASSVAEVRRILDFGTAALVGSSASAAGAISKGAGIFSYCSSHSSTQILPVGFFVAVGRTPYFSTGVHPNVVARSTQDVGFGIGDLLVNVESSAGATPGKVSWHCAVGSTFNSSTNSWSSSNGYDVTVSAALIST